MSDKHRNVCPHSGNEKSHARHMRQVHHMYLCAQHRDQTRHVEDGVRHQARMRKTGMETDENHAERERNERRTVDPVPGNVQNAVPLPGLVTPADLPTVPEEHDL
ncbi:hypothetical protein FN846DRAFT_910896 [Sphaerosporella brunnea]|uniref:Uncharacterized protein n=1 Tax=Sphaerosporella brunnea TaxID=1250544 RepID=A0A5J5ELD3_9PEZI|nr:hypothetical protein FN846DRAFT_910896 [Sphaerosporella brunnea]